MKPGEVADVREAGDEQRVDARVGEAGPEPVARAGDVHRRQARAAVAVPSLPSRATAASTARRYPVRPKPAIVPVTYGATTERRRHSSRDAGFERCSSTLTPSNAASASASANE